MDAEDIDLMVVENVLHRLVVRSRVGPAHDHVDERVHALERLGESEGIGDRPRHIVDEVGVARGLHVEHAEVVVPSEVRRHERADHPGTTDEQHLHERLPPN